MAGRRFRRAGSLAGTGHAIRSGMVSARNTKWKGSGEVFRVAYERNCRNARSGD